MTEITIPNDLLPQDGRFGAGPSKVRDAQLDALRALQPGVLGTSHRQAPVKNLVQSIREGLASLYNLPDGYEVLLANGGATTFWDSAVHSLIENRSQHAAFGEFGNKFYKAAQAAPFLETPDLREAPGGELALNERVDSVDVYAFPHNETSTGVMSPVKRIAPATEALTVVDATSAAGGVKVDIAETDVYYFSPQKNFAADGGIWFAIVSPAAIERIARVTASGRYIPEVLNLQGAVDNSRLQQTLNTPALSTLALMDAQVRWINENGGIDFADARTKESSGLIYEWAEKHELATPFVADKDARSQVIATVDFADSVDAAQVAKILRANGIVDTEPYRKLGRNQLRIATFTAIEPADIAQLLKSIDYVLGAL